MAISNSHRPSSIKGAVTYGQDPVAALGDAQWPPALYPDAKLEDVGCHYFLLQGRNHWSLIVVRKNDAAWTVEFFSSLTSSTHDEIMRRAWSVPADYLFALSAGSLDLRQTSVAPLRYQPLQDNDNDSGVFVLAAVRQVLKRQKLDDVTPSSVSAFRKRINHELQAWKAIA